MLDERLYINTLRRLLETASSAGGSKTRRLRQQLTVEAAQNLRDYINKYEAKPIRS